ncbi:MAG: hypothetical protein EOO01_22615 [Chitinophagaceae bacterium]|nr:MAG: hypothetical protein EOO01_22615 [Chitinophagaceae bacterium]
MRPPIQEAHDFLNVNKDLVDEMDRYDTERGQLPENFNEDDEKLMNRYHRLKTYILEKKMGLLTGKIIPSA